MPLKLSITVGAEIILLTISALFFAVHEVGIWKLANPAINVIVLIVFAGFIRRIRFTNSIISFYCIAGATLGGVYLGSLMATHSMQFTGSTLLMSLETLILVFLFFVLRQKESKAWYQHN